MRTILPLSAFLSAITAAVTVGADSNTDQLAAHHAHERYVEAINANSVDQIMAVVTDDIVYLAPNTPEVVGRAAVRGWLQAYFTAYKASWQKTSLEFVVVGDWAFERYGYKSVDTPTAGGNAVTDTGSGINIYHRDTDGIWRVARDAWATAQPVPGS